jgi:protein-S-isoprenylcysteine O-methyltransferase Ste14
MKTGLKTAFVALRGLFYAVCFVGLWSWVAISVAPLDARFPISIPYIVRVLGWPVGFVGAVITAWCVGVFITQGKGTPAPFDPPREFVSRGPYRYARNPMYVGALVVILGGGMILGSISIIGLSVAFGLLAHGFVRVYEEPVLEKKFGESYRRYCLSVNRWIPLGSKDK